MAAQKKELEMRSEEAGRLQEGLCMQEDEIKQLQDELSRTRASWSYRLGRMITWLPRKIRRMKLSD